MKPKQIKFIYENAGFLRQYHKSLALRAEPTPIRPDNSKWYVDNSTQAILARGWSRFMDKTRNFMTVYEEVIGMTQVREAHERVLQAERKFLEAQEIRRAVQGNLTEMQKKLREIQTELDGMPRGKNPKYIELAQAEYNIIREEEELQTHFKDKEKHERETFHELSRALRFSHEKERAQNEKTKYWSIVGSLIGACIGIIGSSITSSMRMRQLKKLIVESKTEGEKVAFPSTTSPVTSVSDNLSKNILSSSSSSAPLLKILDFSYDITQDIQSASKSLFLTHNCANCADYETGSSHTSGLSTLTPVSSSPNHVTTEADIEQILNRQEQRFQLYLLCQMTAILLVFFYDKIK